MPADALPTDAALLIALFLAHFLLDFPLQPERWVQERYNRHAAAPTLYLHTAAHGVATGMCFLLFGASAGIAVTLGAVIFLTHYITDLIKSFSHRDSLIAFVVDQLAHWILLIAVWQYYTEIPALNALLQLLATSHVLLIITAYVIVLLPTSIVVSLCLAPWLKGIRHIENEDDSLAKAGAMIGYLERLLILTFVLVNEYTAIGFVLALKTAFRFKDTEDRRKAEYMMMGTFLSFSITIGLGLLVKHLLGIF